MPAEQLPLSLPHRPQMTRADFLVGAANAAALALIDAWPAWPASTVVLAGPPGSGKSHLVEIWRARSAGSVAAAGDLAAVSPEDLVGAPAVALEDIHIRTYPETALFHLLNLARERGTSLLLTTRVPVADLNIGLPDLASRLKTAQPVELGAPDDALLRAVLVKLFADRQLAVETDLIEYILRRTERSLEAVNALVERIDREALAAGGPVSRRLVATALATLPTNEPDAGPDDDENPGKPAFSG
jgi:chromosomal replication initiation ATPase DnaA